MSIWKADCQDSSLGQISAFLMRVYNPYPLCHRQYPIHQLKSTRKQPLVTILLLHFLEFSYQKNCLKIHEQVQISVDHCMFIILEIRPFPFRQMDLFYVQVLGLILAQSHLQLFKVLYVLRSILQRSVVHTTTFFASA